MNDIRFSRLQITDSNKSSVASIDTIKFKTNKHNYN